MYRHKLLSVQRKAAIKVTGAYQTAPTTVLLVIATAPPINRNRIIKQNEKQPLFQGRGPDTNARQMAKKWFTSNGTAE